MNRSKSDALFKKSAQKLEEALKAAGVNLEVITNPEKVGHWTASYELYAILKVLSDELSHMHIEAIRGFMKSSGFRCMAYVMMSCSCQVQICMVGCVEASAWVSFLPRHSCHNMSPVYDIGVQKWIGKKLPSSIWSRFTRLGAFLRCLIIACSQERVALRSKMTRATNTCHSR